MGRCGAEDQQLSHAPGLEQLLLEEFAEDPWVVGIADGVQRGEAGGAVVGMVESPADLQLPGLGQHDLGAQLADAARDLAPGIQGGLQRAVGEIQDHQVRDADQLTGLPLLLGADLCRLLRVSAAHPGFAGGEQQVGHLCTLGRPASDGGRAAVFHVIGMGHDAQDPAQVRVRIGRKGSGGGAHRPSLGAGSFAGQSGSHQSPKWQPRLSEDHAGRTMTLSHQWVSPRRWFSRPRRGSCSAHLGITGRLLHRVRPQLRAERESFTRLRRTLGLRESSARFSPEFSPPREERGAAQPVPTVPQPPCTSAAQIGRVGAWTWNPGCC